MIKVAIPRQFKGLLRLGTCSWKYDSWKGLLNHCEGSAPLSIGRFLEVLPDGEGPPGSSGGSVP
jgi:hypothetical protein